MKDYYSFTTEYGMRDKLFQAVLSLEKERVERLRADGVTLTEDVKNTLVNGGGPMVSNKPAAPFWYLYITDLENIGKEDFVYISRIFFEETGAPLYYSDTLAGAIYKYYYNTAVFVCLTECYDLKKLNKKKTLEQIVRKNRVDLLEICAKNGWLKQSKKRDELIEYANAQNKPECTAWLLDFKNRTADLSAERAKAEKKAERELNAAPDSALELGKLWSWKKQEDGTLMITSYKGEQAEVDVPSKIGNNIVTAIGEYALSYAAKRANNKTSRLFIEKITVPNGIKTICEGALGGAGMWGKSARLKEVALPETLDVFTDRQAAETAPNILEIGTNVTAVIPDTENAVFYCVKNNISYRFADSDEIHIPYKEAIAGDPLFSAVLECDRKKYAELKQSGAVLTDYIKDCLLHEKKYTSVLRWLQNELHEIIFKADEESAEFILSALRAETGAPLYLDMYKYSSSMPPRLFDCALEYCDMSFLKRTQEMQRFINNEQTEHLAVCAKHGWLKNAATRDKMIQYAVDNNKTESTAFLLDFKNRTTTPEAERRREEKRIERELNKTVDPNSPKELKKRWRTVTLEDGTLEIDCYKGKEENAVVPEKIGEEVVTSIGRGAFTGYYSNSPKKSKDRDFCEFHEKSLISVVLPQTVRRIGDLAFSSCNALLTITLPDNIESIGFHALSAKVVCIVTRGSKAEEYCKARNIKFGYKDGE